MTLAAALRIDDAWWPRPQRGGHRHTVGARRVDPASWLRPREHDDELVRISRTIRAEQGPRAFGALPGTEQAGAAVLALIGAEPEEGRHPLDAAGRSVAEDLCLIRTMIGTSGAEPVLTAGSVTMPSGWSIDQKLGRTMLHVHQPVPEYAEQIGSASDQLIGKLAGDRIVARVNWTMQAGTELFRAPGTAQAELGDVGNAQLRVEYQTLRAVTADTVLFTIRTAMEPLHALTDRPALLAALRESLQQLPAEQRAYKGMAPIADPVLSWLDNLRLP